jgi:mRNA interferase RelE/StbE
LDNYRIAETDFFQKKIKLRQYNLVSPKILEYVYPILKKNPYFGPNIKKLKGKYDDIYRFRIGDYRLFYKPNENDHLIFILNIENRKDAYK